MTVKQHYMENRVLIFGRRAGSSLPKRTNLFDKGYMPEIINHENKYTGSIINITKEVLVYFEYNYWPQFLLPEQRKNIFVVNCIFKDEAYHFTAMVPSSQKVLFIAFSISENYVEKAINLVSTTKPELFKSG